MARISPKNGSVGTPTLWQTMENQEHFASLRPESTSDLELVDNNVQIFEMYGAHKGEKEMKNMEIVYGRKP